ncbi:hypothetical protein C8R47DRAFT_1062501 [Mycena vitilis]|nr:hypothetical protein C8R47DRAFT_1062501 [Mycena vitilis]
MPLCWRVSPPIFVNLGSAARGGLWHPKHRTTVSLLDAGHGGVVTQGCTTQLGPGCQPRGMLRTHHITCETLHTVIDDSASLLSACVGSPLLLLSVHATKHGVRRGFRHQCYRDCRAGQIRGLWCSFAVVITTGHSAITSSPTTSPQLASHKDISGIWGTVITALGKRNNAGQNLDNLPYSRIGAPYKRVWKKRRGHYQWDCHQKLPRYKGAKQQVALLVKNRPEPLDASMKIADIAGNSVWKSKVAGSVNQPPRRARAERSSGEGEPAKIHELLTAGELEPSEARAMASQRKKKVDVAWIRGTELDVDFRRTTAVRSDEEADQKTNDGDDSQKDGRSWTYGLT